MKDKYAFIILKNYPLSHKFELIKKKKGPVTLFLEKIGLKKEVE